LRAQAAATGVTHARIRTASATLAASATAKRLIAIPCSHRERMAAFVSWRRTYPSYCSFSAMVRSDGLITVAPMAARICRMDFRTASRKALLAFSIKCHRSAT
jgi:hypothetical protein